jgi:hypothetical protein
VGSSRFEFVTGVPAPPLSSSIRATAASFGHPECPARPSRARLRCAARVVVAMLTAGTAVLAASTTVTAAPASSSGPFYYVAIGASETLGFQATGPNGATRVTDQGYTNDLVAMESARWPNLQLALFACPGLRVDMALYGRTTNPPGSIAAKTTSGRCERPGRSEVGTASTFIRSHRGQVALVTLDLGYADVAACLKGATVDSACVSDALSRIRSVLPTVVSRLRAAGGSSLRIVGLDHEDPFLAYFLGKSNPHAAFAAASVTVTERFGDVVNEVYASVGVRVAEVGAAFTNGVITPSQLSGRGTVPLDVKRICTLTWMCTHGNIHPNTKGYRVIASAVAAVVAGSGP